MGRRARTLFKASVLSNPKNRLLVIEKAKPGSPQDAGTSDVKVVTGGALSV